MNETTYAGDTNNMRQTIQTGSGVILPFIKYASEDNR